jgi:iron complex transport system substrate-binding protein
MQSRRGKVLATHFGLFVCLELAACSQGKLEIPKSAVVSTTLCTDGYVHAFPELEPRLAALSWQSKSALSLTPEHLRSLPQTDSNPERALLWQNTIQISSSGGSGDIDLKWGENFETVWENLELISTTLSLPSPSHELKARLSSIKPIKPRQKVLYLDRSGATAGPGTFVHEVIRAAGAVNVIETPGWQSPDIEMLIQYDPDIIITSFMDSDYSGVNDLAFRHKALSQKIASLPQIQIPGKYWPCAGPGLVDAAEQLSKSLMAL